MAGVLYRLIALGSCDANEFEAVRSALEPLLQDFGLQLGTEVTWEKPAGGLALDATIPTAVAYFGAQGDHDKHLDAVLESALPILPIASSSEKVPVEIPARLIHLNCLVKRGGYDVSIACTLLESVGLLRRERRLFLSYRRSEASEAAAQLFEELSRRNFDVFLDTHSVGLAEDFQETLWHRLADCDVLVMLDTPNYFDSRWTAAEFGRALAKGISVLRVQWPDTTPSRLTQTASRLELVTSELDFVSKRLSPDAIDRICGQAEVVRSQSQAVRRLNLLSKLRFDAHQIGGKVISLGGSQCVTLELPDGRQLTCLPTLGVPTSEALHRAARQSRGKSAVLFDPIGVRASWLAHLDWLGNQIAGPRWLKATDMAWVLADW